MPRPAKDAIHEAEPFAPTTELPPLRGPGGTAILPRLTTTDEQHIEAIKHFTELAASSRRNVVRGQILWGRHEPTVLEVTFTVEHIDGEKVWLPFEILETTLEGGIIHRTEDDRLALLQDEISEMHERGDL
jgi:hypothetical protein